MLVGGPQNTIKSHLVFTALFCFAPFSVFSCRMSAPHWYWMRPGQRNVTTWCQGDKIVIGFVTKFTKWDQLVPGRHNCD
jgi:hypothetical protein